MICKRVKNPQDRSLITKLKKQKNILSYLPHRLGFLCSHRGSNLIFHAHCLLSKKLVAALIVTGEGGAVTGEGGAETIADNNSKQYNIYFSPGEYFSSIFPQHIKKNSIFPVKQHESEV